MTRRREYKHDHLIAKAINCGIVLALMMNAWYFDSIALSLITVVVWFFGINPIQYAVEALYHHKHKTERL